MGDKIGREREAETVTHESCSERLLVVSLAVTLDKIRNKAGSEAIDEVIKILHQKKSNRDILRI